MPRVTQKNKIGLSLGPQESFLVAIDWSPKRRTVTTLVDIDLGAPFIFETVSDRSEEHTSELQSHSFISYAVFCLKKKKVHR